MSSQTPPDVPTFDREAFSIVSLDSPDDDRDYWLSRSPEERLQHLEPLRRINYGDLARGPFPRVLEIVELDRR